MFKIYDYGRECFYQWDLNQKLIVEDPTVTEVHFCNKTDDCSLVVEVHDENGLRIANVPNVLLQSDWTIRAYAYATDHTLLEKRFKVNARSKPADYIYTETEVKNFEALEKRIEEIANSGGGGTSIIVDTEVNAFSDNPIANSAIKRYVDDLERYVKDDNFQPYSALYADTAHTAISDTMGNVIYETYATKEDLQADFNTLTGEISSQVERATEEINSHIEKIENGEIIVGKAGYDAMDNMIHTTYATKEEVGDISTALDAIIAIDNKLLGVSE